MKVLIIDNSIAFTGAFKCALNEAEVLSDNHRFVFVMPPHSTLIPVLQEKGFTVYTLPMKEIKKSAIAILQYPFALIVNISRLKRIAKKERVDVVQVNDFYNLLGAGIKIASYKVKLITYVRFVPSAIPSVLRKLWIGIAQKYSNRVIAVSDTVLNQLPYKPNTIRIYDPANLEEKIPVPLKDRGTVTLLYLSNYIRGKGQDYALEAFIHAYAQNKALRLKFMGGDMGLEKNREFKQLLQEKAIAAGLKEEVSFEPFTSQIEKEIKAADILLNFSDSESFSMTCLEASYYGTPVIATRCGGPEEIVVNGKTGLLVHKADIIAMTNAMLTLAGNEHMRNNFSAAGREYVRNKFSVSQFTEQFEHILHER